MLLRRFPANLPPCPASCFGGQFRFDAFHLHCRRGRVCARDAADGQRRQLLISPLGECAGRQLDEPLHGRFVKCLHRFGVRRLAFGQIVHGVARAAQPVGFKLTADARPDIVDLHALIDDQRLQHGIAGIRRIDELEPQRHRFIECRDLAPRQPPLQGVAGDFLIRLLQARIVGVKHLPSRFLAHRAQPVATQFVGNVAAVIALQKVAYLRRIDVFQPGLKAPVVDIDREFVPLKPRRKALERILIARFGGIACSQQDFGGNVGHRGKGRKQADTGKNESRQ